MKLFAITLKCLTGIFFIVLSLVVKAQDQKWDTASRPEIYPLLTDLFRSEKHSNKDIVFLGNSITFWGLFNQTLGNPYIKNRGIPGDITNGVLERLDEITKGKPSKIFLLIGINDLAREIPDSIIIKNYTTIVNRIKTETPGTKLFLQSILPTNSSFNKLKTHYGKETSVAVINTAIQKIALETHATFIDLHALFADKDGQLIKELTFDGVHLTKKGYDKWIQLLKKEQYIK